MVPGRAGVHLVPEGRVVNARALSLRTKARDPSGSRGFESRGANRPLLDGVCHGRKSYPRRFFCLAKAVDMAEREEEVGLRIPIAPWGELRKLSLLRL